MILRRIGNKSEIAPDIYQHFPYHKIYYEPFFGSGGMFFSKPPSAYSILNDIDSDVINLFRVVKDSLNDFLFLFESMPVSEELFYYWIYNPETDSIKKALRFLYLSNFSLMGKNDTFLLLHSHCTHKQKLTQLIQNCSTSFANCMFRNVDFRDFFKSIRANKDQIPNSKRFIYADPPYLGTTNNYPHSFTYADVCDLFDVLTSTGIRFAYSEFANPEVLKLANKHNLRVISIGERRTITSRNKEILIVNYETPQLKLF